MRKRLAAGETVVVAADCEVDYEGRGRSRLGRGERLIILKPDGTVLVHRPFGYEPVNWQPPGTIVSLARCGETAELRAIRSNPREILIVKIHRVLGVCSWKLKDTGEFAVEKEERDIRDALAARPDMIEEGLKVVAVEYPVREGYVDILAEDRKGRLVVVEVKRGRASTEAVAQLKRYVDALRREARREVRGVLAAPSISPKALTALKSLGLEYKKVEVEKCVAIAKRLRKTVGQSVTLTQLLGLDQRPEDID